VVEKPDLSFSLPTRGTKYCSHRTCLFACISQISHIHSSPYFLYVLLVAVAQSPLMSVHYIKYRYLRYCGWRHVYTLVNGPESKTMHMFVFCFLYVFVLWNLPGGGTKGEVCLLQLHLVVVLHIVWQILQFTDQITLYCASFLTM